ncbi:tRNA lysidine(34) synthetase TilS [Phenylobacterium sp.]|uniref:tRNA lysidine(34) synthetase TilS n=1 Tax=Phenylobacterium sp. TaxID=1871053 RepID=UPI002733A3EF|nr:tRNA lysidine(34) synthetase TilS [Phenylobacterium sp.]MDP3855437.1 tRNA lysidine(34) synthetase TilS [Phenylobacterium sp.]
MRGLARASSDDLGAGDVLDRRLRAHSGRPLAVAVSGGGDSVALAMAAEAWAKANGRRLLILTVDHGLNPASAGWTRSCAELAARLGAGFEALAWAGEKPTTGLPAAARDARHRLLAEAARAAGAKVLLMGHTAGDVAEARAMRLAGSTTPTVREWAPSPVWPEGRGLFLLRPLLGAGRAAIRAWLAAQGQEWIDDPANDDLRFARARARRVLDAGAAEVVPAGPAADLARLAAQVRDDPSGLIALPRESLRQGEITIFVGVACLCAAGTSRPARRDRVERLALRLRGRETFTASLAGARVEADDTQVRFMREPGEMARTGLEPLVLDPGRPSVWDGRFEITAARAATILPLAGRAARLPAGQRHGLARLTPSTRPGLPVAVHGDDIVLAASDPGLNVRALAHERLLAACGVVEREP